MTKLCPRGKAAAKRKFAVYPSAYANAYASKICAGKIKDPSGVKRKDFKGPKKAALGAMMIGKKMLEEKMPAAGAALKMKKKLLGMNKGGGLDMGGPRGKAMQHIKGKDKDKLTLRDKQFLKDEKRGRNKSFKDMSIEARARANIPRKLNKGGLKAELNNPAKGYTAGGMADYYKDLM